MIFITRMILFCRRKYLSGGKRPLRLCLGACNPGALHLSRPGPTPQGCRGRGRASSEPQLGPQDQQSQEGPLRGPLWLAQSSNNLQGHRAVIWSRGEYRQSQAAVLIAKLGVPRLCCRDLMGTFQISRRGGSCAFLLALPKSISRCIHWAQEDMGVL
jgi:hypothetical protein